MNPTEDDVMLSGHQEPDGSLLTPADGRAPAAVTVIIPTYNAARHLPAAIASALRQTYPLVDVLVVDDGSTDDTPSVLRGLSADCRLRWLHQPNRGVASARNLGIEHAAGEWIAFLDADDRLHPESVERRLRAALAHPAAGLVFSDRYEVRATGEERAFMASAGFQKILRRMDPQFLTDASRALHRIPSAAGAQGQDPPWWPLSEEFRSWYDEHAEAIHTSTVLVRSDILRKAGRFEVGRRVGEDTAMWRRILQQCAATQCSAIYVDSPLAWYNKHLGDLGKYLVEYRKVIQRRRDLVRLEPEVRRHRRTASDACLAIVRIREEHSGSLRSARREISDALRFDGRNPNAWMWLALSFLPARSLVTLRSLKHRLQKRARRSASHA